MKKNIKLLLLATIFLSPLSARSPFLKDADNFYSKETGVLLLEGLVPAIIMAHTPIDKGLNEFYQENLRCNATDQAAKIIKYNGYNKLLVATYISSLTLGYFFEETQTGMNVFNFGLNSIRSTLIGLPTLILGQNLLGASRPEHEKSRWKPFDNDHSISGHAYMGAVPWLVLANMTENMLLKTLFYIGSSGVGLSRLNDGAHYPSQIILAWVLAYGATNAVHKTNHEISITGNTVSLGYTF